MARNSRVKALAALLKDEKALQQIGSQIVISALAQSAKVGGLKTPNLGDPDWPDSWADANSPPWDNAWGDSNPGGNSHWPDSRPPSPNEPKGWEQAWDNGHFVPLESIRGITERVQPFFERNLTAEEKNVLAKLNITASGV
jgi:hypothetical protein